MDLRTGDVLLFERGNSRGSFFGRVIRLVQGSRYTHCAIVILRGGTPWVADQDGVVSFRPLTSYALTVPVSVWRHPAIQWHTPAMMFYATSRIGDRYGYPSLFECMWAHLAGWLPFNVRKPLVLPPNPELVTCAGFIAQMMQFSADPCPAFAAVSAYTEPDDFCGHGFERVGVLSL